MGRAKTTRTKKTIPIHKLEETTKLGFHLAAVNEWTEERQDAILMGAHRDDHYILFFQERGTTEFMMDFERYILRENSLFFILPGQVHQALETYTASGYFVALDASVVPAAFRKVFEDPLLPRAVVQLGPEKAVQFKDCLRLLVKIYSEEPRPPYFELVMYGLLGGFTGLVAAAYADLIKREIPAASRSLLITRQFRSLLSDQYKSMKSPGEYASALNLSLSYMNETVKAGTGFSVSYWIQHEIMLEARRLLYHSDDSVKQIAYELGYEDPTYFSRLFRKVAGQTPGEFRRRYRE